LKLGWWEVFEQLEHGQIKEKEHELSDEKFDIKCCHKYLIRFDLILDGASWWSITGRAFQMSGRRKVLVSAIGCSLLLLVT